MKIIEAMKQIKDLDRKAEDLFDKINKNCMRLSVENPAYENPTEKVKGWIQARCDVLSEIERLRLAIQRTNLATNVAVDLGGKVVTKSIAAWIHRRRDLAAKELKSYTALSDRSVPEKQIMNRTDGSQQEITLVRHYDVEERDKMTDLLKSEPLLIDARLEVANAVTDLLE